MSNIESKMIPAFAKASGGLFSNVEKADVGDSYQKMEKEGVALMGWADPYMPDGFMPKHIQDALVDAAKNVKATHYTAPIGNADLKQKLAVKLMNKNHLKVDPNKNILITPGSDSGLFFAILPFINKDDEVLIPTPSYPNNALDVEIMGGKVVPIELSSADGYQLNIGKMEAKVNGHTKMVILTHPNNPTTTVYNKDSLEALRSFVIKHDLILIVDQAFEDYTFENEFITPASLDGMWDRTITVFSFSKGMGLSGLRVAYLVCEEHIMDKMYANAVGVLGAASTSAQIAVQAALDDTSFMKQFNDDFDFRRKQAEKILNEIPNAHCELPESGFLCWLDVSKIDDSSKIVQYLLEKAHISVNDGKNYGQGGAGHIRIVLGVYRSNDKIVKLLQKIKTALTDYQNEKKD